MRVSVVVIYRYSERLVIGGLSNIYLARRPVVGYLNGSMLASKYVITLLLKGSLSVETPIMAFEASKPTRYYCAIFLWINMDEL